MGFICYFYSLITEIQAVGCRGLTEVSAKLNYSVFLLIITRTRVLKKYFLSCEGKTKFEKKNVAKALMKSQKIFFFFC